MRGYGLLAIVDHGEGYFSLYAHASKLLVNVGDAVRSNQPIGEIGDTGLTGQSTLYFELRQGGQALDPLPWLIRRRGGSSWKRSKGMKGLRQAAKTKMG